MAEIKAEIKKPEIKKPEVPKEAPKDNFRYLVRIVNTDLDGNKQIVTP